MGERIPKQPNERAGGKTSPRIVSKTPRCRTMAGQRTSPLLALPGAGFINNLAPNQPIQTSSLQTLLYRASITPPAPFQVRQAPGNASRGLVL